MGAALMGTLVLPQPWPRMQPRHRRTYPGLWSKEGNGSGDDAAELAKKLQNPVANLISVPHPEQLGLRHRPGRRDGAIWSTSSRSSPFRWIRTGTSSPAPSCPSSTWCRRSRLCRPVGDGRLHLQSFFFSPKDPVG